MNIASDACLLVGGKYHILLFLVHSALLQVDLNWWRTRTANDSFSGVLLYFKAAYFVVI
jgi:hypothetical protein